MAVFDSMLEDPDTGFAHSLQEHKPRVVILYEDSFNFLSKMCLLRSRELCWKMCAAAAATGAIVMAHGSDAADHAEEYLIRDSMQCCSAKGNRLFANCSMRFCARDSRRRGGSQGLLGVIACQDEWLEPRLDRGSEISLFSHFPRGTLRASPIMPIYGAGAPDMFRLTSSPAVAARFAATGAQSPSSETAIPLRPAESVAAEIAELKSGYGIEHIWFADDIFALNARWTEQFADAMEQYGAVLPFKIQSRADLMRPATVADLKRAGCSEVWMGVESGAQSVLNAMDKGLRVESVAAARELLRGHGIRACYFLQFGYPGEGLKEIEATIDLVRSTRPDDIGVSVSYPLPNTTFYERVARATRGQAQLGGQRRAEHDVSLCL